MCLSPPSPYPLRRRSNSAPQERPNRRALLIGIRYGTSDTGLQRHWPQLSSPHKDVDDFEGLLIRRYDYMECNITKMLDRGDYTDLTPTQDNLVREMRRLVRGAQPGDRLVLYYSGHGTQFECRSLSEDDGFNEAIVPANAQGVGSNSLIADNNLRELLVESLPSGCLLTVICDACSSGTIMDLPHNKCHCVVSPPGSVETQWAEAFSNCKTGRRQDVRDPAVAGVRLQEISIHRRSSGEVQIQEISIFPRRISVPTRKPQASRSISTTLDRIRTTTDDMHADLSQSGFPLSSLGEGEHQCPSPVNVLNECDGDHDCAESPTDAGRPEVWCISACPDGQEVYESVDGKYSFTRSLVKILDSHSGPTYDELMRQLRHERRETYRLMQPWLSKELEGQTLVAKRSRRNLLTICMPRIGSERKKDIKSEKFTM